MKCNYCMGEQGEFLYQTINDLPINTTFKNKKIESIIPKKTYVVLCNNCYIKARNENL